ncbi:MAG: hypothetical protein ACK515_17865 [bacterium]|jgi:hypothetical protein
MAELIKATHTLKDDYDEIERFYEVVTKVVDGQQKVELVYVSDCGNTYLFRSDNPEPIEGLVYMFTVLKSMNSHIHTTEHYYKKAS